VGRVQPPHRVYLPLFWTHACDLVVVGTGSWDRDKTWEAPLAFEERAACVRAVLGGRIRSVTLDDVDRTSVTSS
jgi:nicotinamide mononucleotide adenylyltransferase